MEHGLARTFTRINTEGVRRDRACPGRVIVGNALHVKSKKSYYDTAETAPKIWAHQNSLCKANPANIKYISMEMFRMMKLNR